MRSFQFDLIYGNFESKLHAPNQGHWAPWKFPFLSSRRQAQWPINLSGDNPIPIPIPIASLSPSRSILAISHSLFFFLPPNLCLNLIHGWLFVKEQAAPETLPHSWSGMWIFSFWSLIWCNQSLLWYLFCHRIMYKASMAVNFASMNLEVAFILAQVYCSLAFWQVIEALAQSGLETLHLIVGIDFTKSNEWTGMGQNKFYQ